MAGHHMHEESLFVQRNTLQLILEAVEARRPIIPVGTTSLRVLESLFWGGAWIRSGKVYPNASATSGRAKSLPGQETGTSGRGKGAVHSDIPFPTSHLALRVSQWAPYEAQAQLSGAEALRALLDAMDANGQEALEGHTQLLIAPGYTFRLASGLITNFHQPRSTLLLLIAAMVGDNWRRIYQYALDNDFRFLSYGDSSLLLP
ncbi:MAG: S-adenosylmethionine:tRNA ribosyltransferase-isomerase [Lewinellaceae bacterium]|nr:S-adenosylmethionine:tRNA ribosyltransferase-isomerase [Lewinellaceae bacterium]